MNKLGFGLMRLPKLGDSYDWDAVSEMVDAFMAGGGNYFDTCYTYLDGNSDIAVKKCIADRKDRSSFRVAEKLPGYSCKSDEDLQRCFDESRARCGVEYFDVLLLHCLTIRNYAIAQQYDQFRFLQEKKAAGLAKRIGFSYHGNAALLDEILTAHPEVDVVLLQINYLDWEAAAIESGKCCETCRKHGKSILAMEPVKGGTLAQLPEEAEKLLRSVHPDWTPADWALRFVQSLPDVEIVLSGMSALSQVEANIKPFQPLTEDEVSLLMQVRDIIEKDTAIACTGCGYCVPHCPKHIPINQIIKMYNEFSRAPSDIWKVKAAYRHLTLSEGKASDCIGCRTCEKYCPQNLPIAEHIKTISEKFDK
ncbi:MAG: aldo/keto reductase [Oscillospiraceae bacterium]|nr:aldo/keto reductase [Oscillospiraceae bacterium]